ncbi:Ribonuclease H [Yarrowia sp. C11]|nr:Ribonuclease H [Yarrowia sp. E02]KAG5373047.1 Ribonuclease H [Yarrowia sp. C11]
MKKYYAVKVGYRTGIYNDFSDARDQIFGYSGAEWRGFNNLERAREYLRPPKPLSAKPTAPRRYMDERCYVISGTIFSSYKLAQRVASGRYPIYAGESYDDALNIVRGYGYYDPHDQTRRDLKYVDSNGNTVYQVYTDGACSGNGRPGAVAGYAVFFGLYVPENCYHRLPGPVQTNQRAELMAILEAYKIIDCTNDQCHYQINTDSAYALNCIQVWSYTWRRNGWINSKGLQVANKDLIEKILDVAERPSCRNVTLNKVEAHSYCEGNNSADLLARRAVDPTAYLRWLDNERIARRW